MEYRDPTNVSGVGGSIVGSVIGGAQRAISGGGKRSGRSHGGGSSRRGISGGSSGRRRSFGGGGGGGNGGGGGGGGGGGFTSHAAAPVIPSIAAYLGTDSAYNQAVSGGKRTLADYIADIGRRRGEANTQYKNTTASMARDRATQLDQLRQEFASRGLINSGLFGQKEGEFQQQYNDQLNALGQQQSGLLADLLSQQHNYQREYELAIQQAKQEALARRAAKYQIG